MGTQANSAGYEIYKVYCDLFAPVTLRLIYYHLKKGVILGEFNKGEIKVEKGDYSWGTTVEKTYYEIGPNAKPVGMGRVVEYFEKRKKKE